MAAQTSLFAAEEQAVAPAPAEAGLLAIIEKVATTPGIDINVLERLMAMQERAMGINAKAAFDGAFAKMQPDLPEVGERGRLEVKGVLRSTYARLEDIHAAIKPVLAQHGFAMRHRTEWPEDRKGIIRVVGILSHEQGHSEVSVFEAPMDRSDYRTDIQSMGSTVSYGRRYTTLDLLNITTRGLDDDGKSSGQKRPEEKAPAGYDPWFATLEGLADSGEKAFNVGFEKSPPEFRTYLARTAPKTLAALKNRARGRS